MAEEFFDIVKTFSLSIDELQSRFTKILSGPLQEQFLRNKARLELQKLGNEADAVLHSNLPLKEEYREPSKLA